MEERIPDCWRNNMYGLVGLAWTHWSGFCNESYIRPISQHPWACSDISHTARLSAWIGYLWLDHHNCLTARWSLIVRARLYSSCVWSTMLYGRETWPIRKENEVTLQQKWKRIAGCVALSYMIEFQVKGWQSPEGRKTDVCVCVYRRLVTLAHVIID